MYEPEGVEVAHAGGAIVEDTTEDSSLDKIPPWMVDKALSTMPRKVVVVGPDRKYRMELYKDQIYFGAGSDTPFTWDPYTGERRRAINEDVKNEMRKFLKEIQSGEFAREWILENRINRPVFNALDRIDKEHLIEKVGEPLRARMTWLKK